MRKNPFVVPELIYDFRKKPDDDEILIDDLDNFNVKEYLKRIVTLKLD